MKIFVDTSAIFALLVQNDYMHVRAKTEFLHFAEGQDFLLTSSFVLVETTALLQRRIGMPAVHDFNHEILPLPEVIWIDSDWYNRALHRLQSINRREVSLVDSLSFEIMDSLAIKRAFCFDKHFAENGFEIDVAKE